MYGYAYWASGTPYPGAETEVGVEILNFDNDNVLKSYTIATGKTSLTRLNAGENTLYNISDTYTLNEDLTAYTIKKLKIRYYVKNLVTFGGGTSTASYSYGKGTVGASMVLAE